MKHKKKYYIIGIGGVAMAALAGLLKQKGYEVAGSDSDEMYEPMKSMLAKYKISTFTPYQAPHIKQYKPDIVIVGNAISRGNPELEFVLSNGHSYRSVSDILKEKFIEGKKPIVITGTHGKTTTAALVAWILEYAGLDPTVFIGGFTRNFEAGFKLGNGDHIVLEGDEYDTCFFDKNPKFLAYRPYIGLVNNIELDHIDIYKDLNHIKDVFRNFIKLVPKNGLLVVNKEEKNAWGIVSRETKEKTLWKNNSAPNITTFGLKLGNFTASNIRQDANTLMFHVKLKNKKFLAIKTQLAGNHNISNILAAIAIANFLDVSKSKIAQAIESFEGVKRRLEVIEIKNGITIIDDYAHHPTAVRETILALRQRFRMKRIIVLFEPGSASSKRKIFESEYINAFKLADVVFLYKPFHVEHLSKNEIFNGKAVASVLKKVGLSSIYFSSVDKLLFHVKTIAKSEDVIVIMSCRGFDGLREKILEQL